MRCVSVGAHRERRCAARPIIPSIFRVHESARTSNAHGRFSNEIDGEFFHEMTWKCPTKILSGSRRPVKEIPGASLQHDGVVMVLSQGVTPTDACAALTEVCTAALGYAQPVEEKPFQFDPGDSEDDQDSVADVDAP